ncbi:MAG: MmgE/PrpD family protein [Lachnospiraceae bacterium]|nr:MmgE/PrpD family protein [Lachnospiraceae bacterium]
MKNITQYLSEVFFSLQYGMLDEFVIERTKLFIADYYAACFAGYKINKEFNRINLEYVKEMGGSEQASVLFDDMKFPAENAAYINSLYAHGADMDDGNRISAGHIGASVLSAVFALGEKLHVTWKEILLAVNVGYEAFNRIAGAAQPGLYKKGFHATGTAGGIAAGAACAKLLKLSEAGIYNTISLAALQASGLLIIDESGQACKPINAANAARIGVRCAVLAEKGVEAPKNPLESSKGWFHAFTDNINEKVILDNIGKKFTICESYLKIYPTCRHTHSCIDAALIIRDKLKGTMETWTQVQRIEVFTYFSAIQSTGKIRYPKTAEEAKFSIYYAIAAALVNGRFSLADLDVEKADPAVWYLADRITLIEDSSMEDRESGIRGAKVMVIMEDERVVQEIVQIPRGEGSNLLTWTELEEKLQSCGEELISLETCTQMIERCKNLAADDAFESICRLIGNFENSK